MLVLSRRKNQAIRIGDEIEVVVSQIRGNSVRLAISAPSSVPVFRKELVERMEEEATVPSAIEPRLAARDPSTPCRLAP